VYLYNSAEFVLQPVHSGDIRKHFAAGQDFVLKAPVILLMVADISKFRGDDEQRKIRLACMDGGIVSQNINLFCASRDLATVSRAMMDDKAIREILKLKDSQHLILNNPVGHKK
jgi:nitroreductase